jgi:hypothetical protein
VVSSLTVVATSASKADCKLGNGKTVETKSARQSKSWQTRCRFWIERPRTEAAQRLLNLRSPPEPVDESDNPFNEPGSETTDQEIPF